LVTSQPAVANQHLVTSQPGAANQHLVTSQPGAANQHLVTSQPAVANQHLVTSQPVAANHLAANPPSINVQILVISQRRQSRHPIAAMMAQNAHHLPQKSASAQHGQGVMPHRRAVKAH
jgi:methionine-rich copper-binding protein CopC